MSACTVDDVLTALEGLAKGAYSSFGWLDDDAVREMQLDGWDEEDAKFVIASSPATLLALLAVARAAWAGQDPKTLRDALAALTTLKVGG